MEMLEDDVAGAEAGEAVQEGTEECGAVCFDAAAEPCERTCERCPVLERHQKRKNVRDRLLREQAGQPEERAAPQIKREGAAHARAEVDLRIPEQHAVSHSSCCKNVKRNLLYVVVAVIEEISAVINNKREYRYQVQQYSGEKHLSESDLMLVCLCSHFPSGPVPYRIHRCRN